MSHYKNGNAPLMTTYNGVFNQLLYELVIHESLIKIVRKLYWDVGDKSLNIKVTNKRT